MLFLRIVLLFSMSFALISGMEKPAEIDGLPLADTEGEGSSIVGGCVNALTGTYVSSHRDLTVAGAEPLMLVRAHTHLRNLNSDLKSGWSHNFHCRALIDFRTLFTEDQEIKLRRWEGWFLSPHGHTTAYEKESKHKPEIIQLPLAQIDFNFRGLTNLGSGVVSGQTSIKNLRVEYHRNHEMFLVTDGAGHRYNLRVFKDAKIKESFNPSDPEARKRKMEKYQFRLEEERKPNGHRTLYSYDNHDRLKDVVNVNHDTSFGSIHFHYASELDVSGKAGLTLTGSDGRFAKYYFDSIKLKHADPKKQYFISKVESSENPTEEYRYVKNENETGCLLTGILRPDNRYLKLAYHCDKVCEVVAPVGKDNAAVQIHRFYYHANHTNTYNASSHQTVYRYNDEMRLTDIERYTGIESTGYSLHSREKFDWSNEGVDKTNLLSHYIEDAVGKVHCRRTYSYDRKGNAVEECVSGLLTGRESPYESEVYRVQRRYSPDDFNLLTFEKASSGMETLYYYLPGTNLLSYKLIQGSGHRVRDFYTHDQNAVLIRQVQDDGLSDDVNDLRGVTQRLITVIKPKSSGAGLGLPSEIEERYLDLATNTENQLKRTVINYDDFGRRIQEDLYDAENILQFSTFLKYDAKGRVIEESNCAGQKIEHKYDANGNCIYTKGPHPLVETFNEYDHANRLKSSMERHPNETFVERYEYNELSQKVRSYDIFDNETRYTYNDFGKVVKIEHPTCYDENGLSYTPVETIGYDFLGRENSRTDADGYTTTQRNTLWGKPAEISYPDGTKEFFEYTLDGKLSRKVEKNGTYTCFSYDELGRKTSAETIANGKSQRRETWQYDSFHLISETDANGNITEYKYDGAGRKSSTTQIAPDGKHAITQIIYDSLGRPHKTIQFLDQDTSVDITEYDLLDQIMEERTEDASGNILHKKNYSYDLQGNCIEEISHRGVPAITTTIYDSSNNPIKVTDALGNATHFTYNYSFINNVGKRVLQKTTTEPNGIFTIETFDVRQNIACTEKKDSFGNLLSKEHLHYDRSGQLACWLESVIVDAEETRIIVNRKKYGPNDRVDAIIEAEGTPEQKIIRYTYNSFGQQETLTKPGGIVLTSKYDALGRLIDYRSSDNTIAYKYTYDNNHNLTHIIDEASNSITTRAYDHLNNMTSETLGNGKTLAYSYDQLSRKSEIVLPDHSSIRYTYDARYLRSVHRLDNSGNIQYSHHYTDYDLSGQASMMKLPSKAGQAKLDYDLLGRRLATQTAHWTETVPQNGYDPVGNLLRTTVQDSAGAIHYSFAYDKLNQLIEENGHVTHTYKHDSLNNCLTKDGIGRTHNALNQVLTAGKVHFTYDLNGNLIEQEDWKYTYDALDRLIAVTHGNDKTCYSYDHFHRRLSKQHFLFNKDKQNWALQNREFPIRQPKRNWII